MSLIDPAHIMLLEQPSPGPALATLLGVQYVLAATDHCASAGGRFGWPLVEQTRDFCLLQNPRALRHYEVVERAASVATTGEMVVALREHPEGPLPIVAPREVVGGLATGTVSIRAYEAGRATLQVTTAGRALLLVRESHVPGWTARVDGDVVPLYPAAGIYFAVPIGAGVHTVDLACRAPGFRTGLGLCCAWILGTLVIVVRRQRLATS